MGSSLNDKMEPVLRGEGSGQGRGKLFKAEERTNAKV